ncbi:MAG: type II toxin-antitoxin system RelE/ParE family toxin [Fimbriiglobus sp.]
MKPAVFSTRAADDLDQIVDYLHDRNPAAAKRFVSLLHNRLRSFASGLEVGEACPDLAPGLRHFVVERYRCVVYYTPRIPGGLFIVRILHGSRDITPAIFSL